MLRLFRKAKSSHIRCRSYAQAMVSGLPVNDGNIPAGHTDCQFSRWYRGEGRKLFGMLVSYRDIAEPQEALQDIYDFLIDNVRLRRFNEAKFALDQYLRVSRRLMATMDMLEREILALVDDESEIPYGDIPELLCAV
jgi:hypothetical protein